MTTAANAFVATHIEGARALGRALAAEIDDPAGFVRALRDGLRSLADPGYLAGSQRIAPGIGPLLGIRLPLLEAVHRALVRELRGVRSARLVPIAEALARDPLRELRWFSCWVVARVLADDPERAWQVMRGLAAEADDWITVDTLATSMAAGILLEPYRWAELEQLVYSPSRWERRLVGSTIATIPFADRAAGRTAGVVARSLALVGLLIGDPEPDVQKSLSWALRNMAAIDRGGRDDLLPARGGARRVDVRWRSGVGDPGHLRQARPGRRRHPAGALGGDPSDAGRRQHLVGRRDRGRLHPGRPAGSAAPEPC